MRRSGGKNGAFFPFGLPSVCTIDFLRTQIPATDDARYSTRGSRVFEGGGGIRVFSSPLSKVDDLDKIALIFQNQNPQPAVSMSHGQPPLIRPKLR